MVAKIPTTFKDLPEATKTHSRESYVGNECDSDQYDGSQPGSGLEIIASIIDIIGQSDDASLTIDLDAPAEGLEGVVLPPITGAAERLALDLAGTLARGEDVGDRLVALAAKQESRSRREILQRTLDLAKTWVDAVGGRGEGAEALKPLCALYHDLLWHQEQHPYYSFEEFKSFYELDKEGNIIPDA